MHLLGLYLARTVRELGELPSLFQPREVFRRPPSSVSEMLRASGPPFVSRARWPYEPPRKLRESARAPVSCDGQIGSFPLAPSNRLPGVVPDIARPLVAGSFLNSVVEVTPETVVTHGYAPDAAIDCELAPVQPVGFIENVCKRAFVDNAGV